MRDPHSDLPDRIGPYHVLQLIGEGGMGVVYEAEQRSPVRRRVAIKTMKVGMDTKEVVARFEVERQALAVMDHPGIAKVFDAGATEDGRPYFVMELVRGIRLDEYCDRHRLSSRERVELFIKVCEAVQHAHHKGVIHRDLKPSNVLVTEEDGQPQPRIIDFGVAKATGQRLTDATVVTTYGQAMGTLAYMSPEQAEMSGLDVDTRADVYSLGVILYELLLGVVPVDPKEVGTPAFMASLIQRDETVPSLSRRLSGLTQERQRTIAGMRRTELAQLKKLLRGDLQSVILKATEKDRARRYTTANGFANDLRRFLADEPVSAHPPSAAYRFRKFARRNRTAVSLAAALAALSVAYVVSMGIQTRRVAAERDRAALEARTAQRVSDFLVELFSVSNPSEARGRSITALEILERGSERIEELADEPVLQGRLLGVMGSVYQGLGLYPESEELLLAAREATERGAGPADSLVAGSLSQLAWLYRSQRRFDDALPLAELARDILLETHGAEHPYYADAQQIFGMIHRDLGNFPEARAALEASLEIRRNALGEGHVDIGWSLYHIGWLTYQEGDLFGAKAAYEEAMPTFEAALEPDDPALMWVYNDLSVVLGDLGEHAEAVRMQERALEIRERTQGPDHPDVADGLLNLAIALNDLGEPERALQHDERALAIRERVFGVEHELTAGAHNNIGLTYQALGRYGEARDAYESAIRIYEAVGSVADSDLAGSLANLGYLYRYVGAATEARVHLERALHLGEQTRGPDHVDLVPNLVNLGYLEQDARRPEAALAYFERAFAIAETAYGPESLRLLNPGLGIVDVKVKTGEPRAALVLLDRLAPIAEAAELPGSPGLIEWERGLVYRALGDEAAAERHLLAALELSRELDGEDSVEHAEWQMQYAAVTGDVDSAIAWLGRMVEMGYDDPWLLRNPALDAIRGHPEYEAVAARIRRSVSLD